MDFITLTDISPLITILSDMIVLIFPYIGGTHHLEFATTGLNYSQLDTNSPESITLLSMVLFYLRVYGEDINPIM